MKRIFSVFLFVSVIFAAASVHASFIYGGTVVDVDTYLSIREQPNVDSREVMRVSNGTKLGLRYTGNQDWWQVYAVDGNVYTPYLGWASAEYIEIDR